MMSNVKELLPIGSVIVLKGGSKKLMVYGIKQTKGDTGVMYDYIGVIYPEGNIGKAGQFLFNHKDIDQVFFKGYENAERTEFVEKLDQYFEAQK